MKKSELRRLIREELEPTYIITWIDRDYKKHQKIFKDKPNGAPENGLKTAKQFMNKLQDKDAKNNYGLYRSISLDIK